MTTRDKQRVRAEVTAQLVKGLFFKHEDLSEVSPPESRSGKAGCSSIYF